MSTGLKQNKHVIIAALIYILTVLLIKSSGALTQAGINVLASLFCCVYMWITISIGWPSLIGIGLLAISGCMTVSQFIAVSFGHSIVYVIILMMLLNYSIQDSGLSKNIVLWFITRKVIQGKPWIFIVMYTLASFVIGLFMDGIIAALILMPLAIKIGTEMGYKQGDSFIKILLMVTMVGLEAAFVAWPMMHTITIMLLAMLETYTGISVSYLNYTFFAFPASILFVFLALICLRIFAKFDASKFLSYDYEKRRNEISKLSKREKWTLGIFIFVIIMMLAPDLLKGILPGIAGKLSSLGLVFSCSLGVVLMLLIHVDDRPLIDFNKALSNIPWAAIYCVAFILGFIGIIGLKSTGINIWMQEILTPIMAALSSGWILFAIVLCTGIMVITNVISGTVSGTIVLLAAVPAVLGMSEAINPIAIGVLVTFLEAFGIALPSASGITCIIITTDYLRPKDSAKLSIPILIVWIAASVLIYPLLNIMFPF